VEGRNAVEVVLVLMSPPIPSTPPGCRQSSLGAATGASLPGSTCKSFFTAI
jgi:hypothetical protein